MNQKLKFFLLRLAFSGLFMALIWWAFDVSEGKSFDITKFIFRFFLFGIGFALIGLFTMKIPEKKPGSNDKP